MQTQDITTPLVSVWMITYNHEPFIAQAIESVLMQKTTFPIELVIGEDCSTDDTAAIVREYADKYPHIIRARLNQPNLGMMSNMIKTLEECQGKYIAMLEGDDYWTDVHKLQKQFDYLEENEDYSVIFHNAIKLKNDSSIELFCSLKSDSTFTTKDLFRPMFVPTASIMIKKSSISQIPDWFNQLRNGDLAILFLASKYGKIRYLNQCMSVYRLHPNGISNSFNPYSLTTSIVHLCENVNKHLFNNNYQQETEERLKDLVDRVIIPNKYDEFFTHITSKKLFNVLKKRAIAKIRSTFFHKKNNNTINSNKKS